MGNYREVPTVVLVTMHLGGGVPFCGYADLYDPLLSFRKLQHCFSFALGGYDTPTPNLHKDKARMEGQCTG